MTDILLWVGGLVGWWVCGRVGVCVCVYRLVGYMRGNGEILLALPPSCEGSGAAEN